MSQTTILLIKLISKFMNTKYGVPLVSNQFLIRNENTAIDFLNFLFPPNSNHIARFPTKMHCLSLKSRILKLAHVGLICFFVLSYLIYLPKDVFSRCRDRINFYLWNLTNKYFVFWIDFVCGLSFQLCLAM